MNISALGSSQTSATQQTHRSPAAGMRKAMDAAAEALGMSTSDMRGALRGGQSLASLATAKGVSTDTLTSAISSALTTADSSLSSDKANSIAQAIVSGQQPQQATGKGRGSGGPGGPGGGPPPGPPPGGGGPGGPGGPGGAGGVSPDQTDDALSAVADALDSDEDDLLKQLQSGQSLTDIASAAGMSTQKLTDTITSALKASDSSLSDTDAAGLAQKIIEGPPKPQFEQYSRMALSQPSGSDATGSDPIGSRADLQALMSARYSQYAATSSMSSVLTGSLI